MSEFINQDLDPADGVARKDAVIFCGAAALAWNPDFLTAARRRGLSVLAVEAGGAGFAASAELTGPDGPDEHAWIELDDLTSLLCAAAGWTGRYRVVGACALREDWVETTASLADWLDTPSIGLRAGAVCRDKYRQRLHLAEWSPRFAVLPPGRDRTADWDHFPAIVKPTKRSASSGVLAVADSDALGQALAGYPEHETVLVEQRVYGAEFSVESLVQDGRPVFAGVTGKRTSEAAGDSFVELAHTVPADIADTVRAALLERNRQVLERLAVRDGVIHAEYRVDPAGRVFVTEVNARCPGGSIPALYRLATGRSFEDAVVAVSVGAPVDYPEPRRCARQVYVDHPAGVLADVTVTGPAPRPVWLTEESRRRVPDAAGPDEPAALRAVTVIKARGTTLTGLTSNQDRAITYLIDAPTHARLDALQAEMDDRLRVDVTPPPDALTPEPVGARSAG